MLSNLAKPSKKPSSAWYISNQLFLSHNRQSYWCFVISPSGPSKCNYRCFVILASKKNLWGFALSSLTILSLVFHIYERHSLSFTFFKPHSHIFKLCTLKLHVSKPCSCIFKSRLHIFKPCIPKPRFHIYELHFLGSTILSLILLALYTLLTLSLLH